MRQPGSDGTESLRAEVERTVLLHCSTAVHRLLITCRFYLSLTSRSKRLSCLAGLATSARVAVCWKCDRDPQPGLRAFDNPSAHADETLEPVRVRVQDPSSKGATLSVGRVVKKSGKVSSGRSAATIPRHRDHQKNRGTFAQRSGPIVISRRSRSGGREGLPQPYCIW